MMFPAARLVYIGAFLQAATCLPTPPTRTNEVLTDVGSTSNGVGNSSASNKNKKDDMLLRDVPMIMTHDSATGYKGDDGAFVKVQDKGFFDQLNCGARAFDLRAVWYPDDRRAYYHHFPSEDQKIILPTTRMDQYLGDDTFNNFINFANDNPDELIILYLSHCAGEYHGWDTLGVHTTHSKSCGDNEFIQTFNDKKILYLNQVPGCESGQCLETLTFGKAKQMAKEKGQQGIIAITPTMIEENWDAGVDPEDWNAFNSYRDKYLASTPPTNQLREIQAHWQSSGANTAPGDRGFNDKFVGMVKDGTVPLNKLNLVQINWFCQGGKAIAEAIGATGLDKCHKECH